jgi:subtilisin family serine protease
LAVGAVDSSERVWSGSTTGDFVDVAAPGVGVPWVNNAGRSGLTNGTSDSAALVSGVVALLWSKYPQASNRQITAMLLAGAQDVGASGRDDASGWGMVRPWESLQAGPDVQVDNPILTEMDEILGTTGATAGASGSAAAGRSGLSPVVVFAGVGAGVLVLVVVVVVVLVSSSGRKRPPPPPPMPGGHPYPGGQQYPGAQPYSGNVPSPPS